MTGKSPHPRLDFAKASTTPLGCRKVARCVVVDPPLVLPCTSEFERIIPSILKGEEIKRLADAWASAIVRGRAVVLGIGAHVIKVGLNRLIIDLTARGMLNAIATTGAAAIHDLEMGLFGETSEEVAEGLPMGLFGMAEDTGRTHAEAVALAHREGYGLGQALGLLLTESGAPHRDLSVFAAAYEHEIPATIHVTIGADIVHMHPANDAAALGLASYRDFQVLADAVKGLDDGGVYVNVGSAVVLPEVFLKAVNIARNIDGRPRRIITADIDMVRYYRPEQNVVTRPTIPDGIGYQVTGHHEIMIPLLYAMVRTRLNSTSPEPPATKEG